ncbi:lytic polysaccharide monooxygenase auxiliary activity family 9 protein [Kitasatospora purpeofusca]|uniref:lytic polysaccharide monooxygenase auxiliary activity family 9 protein n=1 Tax=Kitasatospora purpeofusca TaxID=67352 RepID=UPI00224C9610|nr:lytic polysaccharide monooxygenase [Kitasatospora purpeofusca]MCX4758110.1 lytic polysaccharide monooxygenase [Kitasatospora purpeofusca]WSR31418.1 lytic polysaccharide monooxygenase [Kitasatospora purpeofusca]
MSMKRTALSVGVIGAAFLSVSAAGIGTAGAHGTVTNPVSRVAACYAEGPETPKSQICKDLVALSGTQPLYDWNEVNLANAAGNHQALIPDGKLCSAGRDKYKALDLPRADWPATAVTAGKIDFKFRVTAPHQGNQTIYITKQSWNPTQPLKWSDLDPVTVAQVPTQRTSDNGYYNYSGTLPQRTGRQLLYMVWQRTDSPEAFYSCSDVDFGKGASLTEAVSALTAQAPAAPSEAQIAAGQSKSTVAHHGHGGNAEEPAGKVVAADSAAVGGGSATGPMLLTGAAAIGLGWAAMVLRRRRVEAVRHDG